jgi:hypothetical protein
MDLLETLKVDYAWVLRDSSGFFKKICEPLCCLICGMRTVDAGLGRLGVWWEFWGFFVDWTAVWDAGIGRCRLRGLIQQRVFFIYSNPWVLGTGEPCYNVIIPGRLAVFVSVSIGCMYVCGTNADVDAQDPWVQFF